MSILHHLFSAPLTDWIYFASALAGILAFIFIAERTRRSFHKSAEVSRKLVHILTGILIFFTPFLFTSNRPLIWMAVVFIIVNYAGVRTGKLKGMHDTDRKSYGTVFYPMTFLILSVTAWEHHKTVLMLAMLILALSDAAAAIVGENLKHPKEYRLGRDKKSVQGSLTMFLMSFLIVFILLPVIDRIDGLSVSWGTAAWIGALTALMATALEALSSGGSDNLSAPLGAAFMLSFMLHHAAPANIQLTLGVGLALLVGVFSYRAGFLTASGSVGTFVLAAVIFGTGGWTWSAPILTFFLLSSILSKMGKAHKKQFVPMFEKSSRRDIGQVLANGAVAGAAMLIYNVSPDPVWYFAFLGALAAVNADTWATEIGIFSRHQTISIRNLKPVPPGTSGGITALGTFSAIMGSLTIALSGLIARTAFPYTAFGAVFWIVVLAGLVASLIDSFLGATWQAQYQCPECRKITEKKVHCTGVKTRLMSGRAWLNNDWVNAFCSASGAALVLIGTAWII